MTLYTEKIFVITNVTFLSFVMFVPTYFLTLYLPSTITSTLSCIVLGSAIYFGILFFLKDETLIESTKKIRGRFVEKK